MVFSFTCILVSIKGTIAKTIQEIERTNVLAFLLQRPKIKYARNAFKALEGNQRTTIDQDVLAEQNNIAARCEEYIERNGRPADGEDRTSNIALEMYGLRKVYPTSGIFKRKKAFVAVEGNWIGIKQGECFCLLGPNGAGKTTTIHCLTGVLPFTAGKNMNIFMR